MLSRVEYEKSFITLGPDQPALKSREQSADLGSYCFHYRLSKMVIIRKREQTSKVVTGGKRVYKL